MKKALNLPEKVAPPAPKPGDKAPMGFMESFRSGVASQTSAPPAPSRQMNDIGRESAMRDLLEGTDKQAAGESAQKRTEGGQQSEATAGGDDKKRRVQAARERRAGRKRY